MNSDTIYVSTADEFDKVTIMDILQRYIDINGTIEGFESYVESNFRDECGQIEYVKLMQTYIVDVEFKQRGTIEIEATSETEAREIAECMEQSKFDDLPEYWEQNVVCVNKKEDMV